VYMRQAAVHRHGGRFGFGRRVNEMPARHLAEERGLAFAFNPPAAWRFDTS